jgi:hypothetical protein
MEIYNKPSMITVYSKVFEVKLSSTIINSINSDLRLYIQDNSSDRDHFQGFVCQFISKGFYKMNYNEITIISENYLTFNRLSTNYVNRSNLSPLSLDDFKALIEKFTSSVK